MVPTKTLPSAGTGPAVLIASTFVDHSAERLDAPQPAAPKAASVPLLEAT